MTDRSAQSERNPDSIPAAFEQPGCCEPDADPTRQKLESLFNLLRGSTDAIPSGPTPGESNTVWQRFRILRSHARGGLGEIWLAEDEELKRQVALKEIQPQFAGHTESWPRFLREATITGQLEHPGIVPIYALGRHENGQPFYAMRFVQGDTLQDSIARFHDGADRRPHAPREAPVSRSETTTLTHDGIAVRNLELRKLVSRLVSVCNAVAYAHSRGVLHRDLKPSNIMLGEFGETLVVDWGLAKPLNEPTPSNPAAERQTSRNALASGSDSTNTPPTQTGSVVGTLPYMSPEQASGQLDRLSPASDVYSLGATLYHVLTGQPPVAGDSSADVLRKAQAGDIVPPRHVRPDLPRPLEAICLKALALRPEDRYATAAALANDMELWLADEPVSAHREPLVLRVQRFARRHRVAFTSLAAALLVALCGFAVHSAIVSAANQRLATANDTIRSQNNSITGKNQELVATNQKLELARADAESRRQDAETAQRDAETKRAEAEAARQQEVEARKRADAVAKYLVKAFRNFDPKLRGRNFTVAEMLDVASQQLEKEFGTEPLTQAELLHAIGKAFDGLGLPVKAIKVLDRAVALRQQHLGDQNKETLVAMSDLALAYHYAGMLDQAVQLNERTLRLMRSTLGDDHPETLTSLNNLAGVYRTTGRLDKAVLLSEQSLEQRKKKLGDEHADTLLAMNNLAVAYDDAGQPEKALSLLESAFKRARATLGEDEDVTLLTMGNLANQYQSSGQVAKALSLMEQSFVRRRAKLGPDHPSTLTALNNLALTLTENGAFKEGLPLLQQLLERRRTILGADHPDTLLSLNNLAHGYSSAGMRDKSLPLYEQVLDKTKSALGEDHPSTLLSMNNLGFAYYSTGQLDKAIPLYKLALERRYVTLGANHSDTLGSMSNLAFAFADVGKLQDALSLHRQAFEGSKSTLGVDHPDTLNRMRSLADFYRDSLERTSDAIPLLEDGVSKSRARFGNDHVLTISFMRSLALTTEKANESAKAELLYGEVVQLARKNLPSADPRIASELANLCRCQLKQNKFTEAEPLLRECLDIRRKASPDDWTTANTESMLGEALTGLKHFDEAEPLLLSGYEGMNKRREQIPAAVRSERLREAVERLVKLYEAWDKPDSAKRWREELDRIKQDAPIP